MLRFMSTKILSSNGNTIICLHPKRIPNISESKPFRIRKPALQKKVTLDHDEVEMVRKLRTEDPSVWTVNTLASLFNARKVDIRRLSPASPERQAQLDKDRETLKNLPLRQRRAIIDRREATRQKKLKTYLSQMNYKFPGLSSN